MSILHEPPLTEACETFVDAWTRRPHTLPFITYIMSSPSLRPIHFRIGVVLVPCFAIVQVSKKKRSSWTSSWTFFVI